MSSPQLTTHQFSAHKYPRRSPRQRIEKLMYVDLGIENGGFPINISEGGMAFHGVAPMQKDQIIHVKFKLPGQNSSVESTAQIAWLNDLQKGGGLRFIDLPEGNRRLIKEWLSLQTSFRGLGDSASIARAPVQTKNSNAAPPIRLPAIQHHSSSKPASSAVAATLNSPRPSPAAIKAKTPGTLFSRTLFASLMIAAILGVLSIQYHWRLQLPTIGKNQAQPVSESVTPASPAAESAHPLPLIGTGNSSKVDDAKKLKTPLSPRTKMAIAPEIKPSPALFHWMEMNVKPVMPSPIVKSPVAYVAPPTLVPPIKPESALQIPVLLTKMLPSAPSPSKPAEQTVKYDPAQLVVRKNPVYPISARDAGISGSVELHFTIGANGHVRDVSVMKGNPLLTSAAVQALQNWRYQPARRDGVAVETESSAVFVFKSN